MKHLYDTSATSEGGREAGRVGLESGGLYLAMALPQDMGGTGRGANPEQLFALGYASCFNQALLVIGRQRKVDVEKAQVTAKVTIGVPDGGGFGLSVDLTVRIPGLDSATATDLTEAAHKICPYSQATRNNIPVTLSVV